jgi:hypothetical protein
MTQPLCQRLNCLDTGPIVSAINIVAHGVIPDPEDEQSAEDAAAELISLGWLAKGAVEAIRAGKLSQTEALGMLADEPCPPTQKPSGSVPCSRR